MAEQHQRKYTAPAEQYERGVALNTDPIKVGNASAFWLELDEYPEGSARSLWLKVNEKWWCYHNPAAALQRAVQNAFRCSDELEVKVWYTETSSQDNSIVGLVVCTKN